MESQNDKLASALLAEVYNDYKREKRYRTYTRWLYVLGFFFIIYLSIQSVNDINFFDELSDNKKVAPKESFVPVIEIFGVIGTEEVNYESVNNLLEESFTLENSPGVILHIDSPGGAPYDCYEITRKIWALKQKYPEKKVIAQVGSVAASGGYYIASAADAIYASEASTVGSIGVVMQYLQFNRFLEKYDIIPHVYQAGKDKVSAHPLKDLTPDGKKELDHLLKEHHEIFINTIKKGRGDKLKPNPSNPLFTGKVWLGTESLELGLIDNLGLFDQMLVSEFGEDIQAHVIEEDFGLDFKKLLSQKRRIQIEGLGLDAKTLLQWNGS